MNHCPTLFRIRGVDGKECGPVSAEMLRQSLAEDCVRPQTLVKAEGSNEWQALSAFPELASPFTPARPPAPAPAPPPSPPLPAPTIVSRNSKLALPR
jgi:hypothetical protein